MTDRRNVTQAISERVIQTRFEDLPHDVVGLAQQCLRDWIGVAIGGSREPLVDLLISEARDGDDSTNTTIVGRPERTGFSNGIIINGAAGHALDFDDGNVVMMGHPSVVLWPGLLALAERHVVTGAQLIEAYVAGCETAGRIGRLVTAEHYQRGYHATATVGALAAVAAAGKLLKLSAESMAMAFGIAGTRASGLRGSFGTMCKPLHAGHAAWVGASSARLAAKGFSGSSDILGDPFGFVFTQAGAYDTVAALQTPPGGYYTRQNRFKWHAACYGSHPTMDLICQLRDLHSIQEMQVKRVVVAVSANLNGVCLLGEPKTGLEIKFSLKMLCAFVLARIDTASPASFTDAFARDRRLIALRDRIQVAIDDTGGPAEARIELVDGRCFYAKSGGIPVDSGHLDHSLRAKFDSLVTPMLGPAATSVLSNAIDRFAQCDDGRALVDRMVPVRYVSEI